MEPSLAVMRIQKLLKVNEANAMKIFHMAKNYDRLNSVVDESTKAMTDHQLINEQYNAILSSVNGSLKRLWERVKVVGTQIGVVMLPFVAAAVGVFKGLVAVLEVVPTPILAAGAAALGLVGAISGLMASVKLLGKLFGMDIIGKFIPSLASACTASKAASLCMGGLGVKTHTVSKQISSSQLAIANAFKALGGGTGLGKLPASIGAAGLSASVATPAVWSFTGALSAMWAAAWPIALVILAIAAAIGIMYVAVKMAIEWWKEGGATVQWFKDRWAGLIYDFQEAKTALKPLADGFMKVWEALKKNKVILAAFLLPFLAPVLPIITALVGGFYLIKAALQAIASIARVMKVGETFDLLSETITELGVTLGEAWSMMKNAFSELSTALGLSGKSFEWLWFLLKAIVAVPFIAVFFILRGIVTVIAGIVSAFSAVVGFITRSKDSIKTALEFAFAPLIWAYKGVMALKGAMFGSSMFHIKEGVRDVTPAMRSLQHSFLKVQRAAVGVDVDRTIPDEGSLTRSRSAVVEAAMSRAGGGGSGAASAGSSAPTTARVTIPVSVELDGMVLARVVAEHIVELGNERSFNEPNFPLRGIEPA
jgi:hypothetical protein